MVTAPTILGERFVLGDWLGEGSLSVVHAATDRASGREVAVKLARGSEVDHASVQQRFEREAAALSVIASAHVVELVAAGTATDGRPYLVLERLRGRNMQEVLVEIGPLGPAQVVRVIGEAARALELAHGLGIVHRDLKPANLFLHATPDGHAIVKVLDFGLVVDVGGPTERERDAFGGTPLFMAPEQVRGQLARIGPETDVWALAHVALTLLTGETYWSTTTSAEILREIESSPLEPPSQRWPWLPPAFDRWFARSTRRVPERRFRDVSEQAARLAEALRDVRVPGARAPVAVPIATAATQMARPLLTPTPTVVRLASEDVSVVGRRVECAAIERQLATGTILTLVGPAGVGKTRIAYTICDGAGERFLDGAWFVALPAGADADAIVSAIAGALELEPDPTRSVFDHLVASLAPRHLLLVIDGLERAQAAGEVIERLRRACPAVTWLATGRLPLGLAHERTFAVEPLDVPSATPSNADEAMTYAGVEMFVRCVQQASSFVLADEHVDDVVAICRAVAGLPLGIELAAARMHTATLAQIRAALASDDPPASMNHAMAWSYGLLSRDAQTVLRHLALLPAGLTFAQLQQQLADVVAEPRYAALKLVESHLLSWTGDRPRRLVMLDTVREFCRDATELAGDAGALWRVMHRHVESVSDRSAYADEEAWLAQLDAEHANLKTVLAHMIETVPTTALRVTARLAWYWYVRGHYAEGARWLEESIERSEARDGEDAAYALHGAGRLALLRCDYRRANELIERARELHRLNGDERGEAEALQLLGSVARERGEYALSRELHRWALALFERLGDRSAICRARNYLLFVAWLGDRAGDPGAEQYAWWQPGAEPEATDAEASTWWLLNRGAILLYADDTSAAREILTRAFAGAIAARFREGIAWSLDLLGRASLDRGEHVQAHAQLFASLQVHRRLGDKWRCASVLEALAALAVTTGHPARGAVYVGIAEAIRAEIGAPVPACERARLDITIRRGAAEIGRAFETGRERGRRTTLDQALAFAHERRGPASSVA